MGKHGKNDIDFELSPFRFFVIGLSCFSMAVGSKRDPTPCLGPAWSRIQVFEKTSIYLF